MARVELKNLRKEWDGAIAVAGVDLAIEDGDFVAVLGPSGCGKTTTLMMLAGIYQPTAGDITFDGERVNDVEARGRNVGIVFQSYALYPNMSVLENIMFPLRFKDVERTEAERRAREIAALVRVEMLLDRRPSQLSGGQQQRVALARALVIRPRCLLLDEPLSNLDAKLRLEMRSEIRRICKEFGLTGIYVTHDRDEALSMADRLAIMEGGRLIQVGSPEEIYKNPATQMVAEFIGEANLIEGRVIRESSRVGLFDVEVPFGVLRARPNNDEWRPVQGQPVVLSVRPEALTFGDVRDSPNRFPGRIISTTYLGATVQYELRVGDQVIVKVCEMNPWDIRLPSNSEEVRAMCSTYDLVMIRK